MKHLKTLLLILIITCYSCSIQKSALKTKTDTLTKTDKLKTDKTKTFDFSTVDNTIQQFKFTPTNPKELMKIITPKGDTIKTLNTSITKTNVNTKTQNNKTKSQNTVLQDNSIVEQSKTDKQKEKTETLSSTFILYIAMGVVIIVCIAMLLLYRMVNKKLSKLV